MNRLDQQRSLFRFSAADLFLFALIVLVGVGSRFWLMEYPNIKPVAALCLLAGFYYRSFAKAFLAGFLILLLSDWSLGSYSMPVAISVYLSIGLACWLGWLIHRRLGDVQRWFSFSQLGAFVGASLTMSTVFYVLTNAMVWAATGWYELSWSGLVDCFVMAIPFYRWTMMGDLTFTVVFLVVWQAALLLSPVPEADAPANAS